MTFTLDQMAYEALLGNPNITEEVILGSGEWIPLMTLCGPLDDVIEDFYSVFYSRTMDGEFRYKAMAHRWCY
jgi:hypothetical protein